MLSAKKARQRPLIVSGGDRILSNIEKLWIFTIVKMRFGMFEVKYQPQIDQCSLGAHSVPEDGAKASGLLLGVPNSMQRVPCKTVSRLAMVKSHASTLELSRVCSDAAYRV
jgi:hypothetical protein